MALVKERVVFLEEVAPCFCCIFMGIATNNTAAVINIMPFVFEKGQSALDFS
jgi:hypothetical protein